KELLNCLDQAIAQVTEERARKLERQDANRAQIFLKALQLFHCQERSMTEIAQVVELKAQFQVSRLLKLKSFRADIRQQLLVRLRDRVIEQAKTYTNPERLQTLNQRIDEALLEQITTVIQEAETESRTAKRTTNSLFAHRLCHYLDTRSNQP
ncbi:MAG: hypothetical protein LDL41_17165, partial [Coleofasciculus sp. S288]|nr:hypothetical protein [Coleofasciculus sp. S288]